MPTGCANSSKRRFASSPLYPKAAELLRRVEAGELPSKPLLPDA
jgi:hypothetical protein